MPKKYEPPQLYLDQSGSSVTTEGFTAHIEPDTPVVPEDDPKPIPMDTAEKRGTSEILIALNKLDASRVAYIDNVCHQIEQENEEKLKRVLMNQEEFENIMRDRIQGFLKLPFDIFDSVARCKDLSYVVHDYLSNGNEPDKPVQEIIRIIWNPLGYLARSWLEMCCQMLLDDQIFRSFFQLLAENKAALEDIIRKNPDILMNEQSDDLLQKRLIDLLSFDFLHDKIMNNLNGNKQTVMFTTRTFIPWVMLYTDEHDTENERDPRFLKLYDLLSIKDVNGNAALHINTHMITQILKFRYTTIHRDELIKLINMEDGNGRKAVDIADGETELTVLLDHLEDNRYLLYGKPLVLIIYTTKDRPDAEKEARSIYHAFDTTGRFETKMEENRSKDEIDQIIRQGAHREEYISVKPSAFIVVLMSHGNVGVVQDFEGKDLGLRSIEVTMCSQKLKDRPKVFITQCCQEVQGDERPPMKSSNMDAGPSRLNRTAYVPKNPHFCAIMSSVSGQPSVRNKFIPKIADQLISLSEAEKGKGTCIMKMVADVCQQMEAENIQQTPIVMSTFKSEFTL